MLFLEVSLDSSKQCLEIVAERLEILGPSRSLEDIFHSREHLHLLLHIILDVEERVVLCEVLLRLAMLRSH